MIIFLYGKNTFLAKQKLKKIKNKFFKKIDPQGNNLFTLDGRKIDIQKINDKIGSSSLLSRKKMVIIKNSFLNKSKTIHKEIIKYLKSKEKTLDDNIIIFIDSNITTKHSPYTKKKEILLINSDKKEKKITKNLNIFFNFLIKQKFTQEFQNLSNTEINEWIKENIEKRKGSITPQAIQLLAGLTNNNLWQINNEIEKLLNYKLNSDIKLIEVKDVQNLVHGNYNENIFALTDAISNKNQKLAYKYLSKEYQTGLTDSYLINMFLRQFKILIKIKQALDSGWTLKKIINSLKLHPFIVQKGINQVRNFNLQNLKKIINQLVEIDYKMKIGQGDARTMLELFIMRL